LLGHKKIKNYQYKILVEESVLVLGKITLAINLKKTIQFYEDSKAAI